MARSVDMSHMRCVRDECGAAILSVITLITVGLALGGVAAVTATNAMRGTVRDESSKDSLAAAEAGAQAALMRQNQVAVGDSHPCVVPSAGTLAAGAAGEGGWCSDLQGTAGDASYEYRVKPPVETDGVSTIEIISTGTTNGVARRIHVFAESPVANAVFATHTVVARDSITLDSNAQILANTGTNGNISLSSNSNVCGSVQYGGSFTPPSYSGTSCPTSYPFSKNQGTLSLPPVDQGDVADPDNNNNWRINPSNPSAPDTISGNKGEIIWSAANRTLTIDGNSALTMGGTDKPYSLCRLRLQSNSQLIVAAGATVRIFFDEPENCPTLGAGPQILLDSNSKFTVTSGQPGSFELFVVGSSNPAVTSDNVLLNSNTNSTMPVTVYAPQSKVELDSNSTLLGSVAAQSVHLDSNARITSGSAGGGVELPVPLHYRQTRFVECTSTSAPPTTPSSSC
jgi:hypothetical protein